MFVGIFSTYFPMPVFGRPRPPIPAGTVSFLRPILETSISESLYFKSVSIILTDDDDDDDDYYYVLLSSSYFSELREDTSFLGSG